MKIDKLKTKSAKIITHIVNHPLGNVDYKWAIITYFALVIVVSIFVFVLECPTTEQITVLRAALAIAVTGLFASIFSKWSENKTEFKLGLLLTLFLAVYLFNPVGLASSSTCTPYLFVNGKLSLGDDPLEGAQVSLPYHDYKTLSNGAGEFALRWNREEAQDSLLVAVKANGIDTSFYWLTNSAELRVQLKDTILPITKSILTELVDQRIGRLEKHMQAQYRKWEAQAPISLARLISFYKPFEEKENYKRNYFHFYGLENELEYRKNLKSAGIIEVKELKPYQKHLFDSCDIYLLKHHAFPEYHLEYLMVNREPLSYKVPQAQQVNDDYYTAKVAYQANIRCVRVKLECSANTDHYKIRQIEFYGFLPLEEYDFHFQHGEWKITSTNLLS
ncbi:MAG: hypothetical protein RIC95_13950 [Vicingaceae bacterium]